MSNLTFYRHPVSGHAHRVELLLSLLNLNAEVVEVDLMQGEQKQIDFLKKNPFGKVPVIEDHGVAIADSTAILIYLAKQYDSSNQWLPTDAVQAAQVQQFLSIASGELALGPANARLITLFGAGFDVDKTISAAHNLLTIIDAHLNNKTWLVGKQATLADVANYAYIAHAPEGNVDLSSYKNIQAWLTRVEALPGFVPMAPNAVGLAA